MFYFRAALRMRHNPFDMSALGVLAVRRRRVRSIPGRRRAPRPRASGLGGGRRRACAQMGNLISLVWLYFVTPDRSASWGTPGVSKKAL